MNEQQNLKSYVWDCSGKYFDDYVIIAAYTIEEARSIAAKNVEYQQLTLKEPVKIITEPGLVFHFSTAGR